MTAICIWRSNELQVDIQKHKTDGSINQIILTRRCLHLQHFQNHTSALIRSLNITWLRAEPELITMEGLTASGGTGNTVTIIQSGRACLGFIPRISHSSSEILLNISWTRSAVSGIFFSCESSLISFHSAVKSRPLRLIWGWFRPQPPWLWQTKELMN